MTFEYGDYEKCNRCGSKNIVLVKRIFSNGAINYQYQCLDCGDSSGSVKTNTIPQSVIDNCPDYDASIKQLRVQRDYEERQLKVNEMAQVNRMDTQAFREWLKLNYYPTPEWQYRRQKRLEFNKLYFGGKCERCRKNEPTVVHHRSYKILDGMEHTFDLEALCEDCHKMLHPHLRDE